MSLSKVTVHAAIKSTGNPSSEELATINTFALRQLSASEVYARSMVLAHNAIDRDGDVFDSALLDDFAKTLPGKGLFVKHPMGWDGDSGPGVGLFYRAKVTMMSQDAARTLMKQPDLRWPTPDENAFLLEADFFIMKTEHNNELISKIDGGIAAYVSVGFNAQQRTDVTDGNGNVIARRLLAPGEALEGSLVWLGAQPGARIHKSAEQPGINPAFDNPGRKTFRKLRDPSVTARALGLDATKVRNFGHQSRRSTQENPVRGTFRKLRDPSVTARALGSDSSNVENSEHQSGKSTQENQGRKTFRTLRNSNVTAKALAK